MHAALRHTQGELLCRLWLRPARWQDIAGQTRDLAAAISFVPSDLAAAPVAVNVKHSRAPCALVRPDIPLGLGPGRNSRMAHQFPACLEQTPLGIHPPASHIHHQMSTQRRLGVDGGIMIGFVVSRRVGFGTHCVSGSPSSSSSNRSPRL